ncbi:MAG: glycosyltransferase, partial [Nitrospirota bacterium]
MKRIAVVKSNYTPFGGAEKYTTRIVNAFVERGCKVDILTSSQLRWEGLNKDVSAVHLKQFPYNSFMKLLTFNRSVAKYLDEHNYDCVFGMDRTDRVTHLRTGGGCHAAWLDRRCKESSKVRCASFRVNPFHRLSVEIESRAFLSPSVKDIFCNSAMVRDEIKNYYPG